MSHECGNCKANPVDIARNTQGTPTAKLIAILAAHGITSAAEIAEIVGISDRAVRKARNSGSGTEVPPGTTGPELQDRPGTQVPKTELQDRNSGSEPSRAHATKETLRVTPSLEVKKIPQTPKFDFDVPRVRFADGRLTLNAELRKFWLDEFANDAKRLDLALIEIGGRIQPNNSRPLEAQVSSQLARIVADRRDRDQRYQSAVVANAAAKASPRPVKLSRW